MTTAEAPAAPLHSTPAFSSRSTMYCTCWSIVSSSVAPDVGLRSVRLKARRLASTWMSTVPGWPLIVES
jgi:hypothetical protein